MKSNVNAEPVTVSVEVAAQTLGIGRNTAYEAVRRGEIPTIRIGRRILVSRAWLARTIENVSKADGHIGDAAA